MPQSQTQQVDTNSHPHHTQKTKLTMKKKTTKKYDINTQAMRKRTNILKIHEKLSTPIIQLITLLS